MPHAERDETMGDPNVSNEGSSLFLSHLSSYPVVSESISTIKRNSYGQRSFQMADQGYNAYAKPLLGYFKPLAPYIAKVDSLGNEGLNRVDGTFPIVKQNPETIRGTLMTYISAPIRIAGSQKEHVLQVYSSECTRSGGDGYVSRGKALVTTGLKVASESLAWLSNVLIPDSGRHQQNGRPERPKSKDN